ncbi:MAG: flagellar biosynthetic protein FliO [Nitrospirota bacterium]
MEFWDSFIRMVSALAVVLGLVLALAVAARRFLRGRIGSPAATPLVQVLGSGYLGARKSIVLVSVAGELLVVGSTADTLVPLGRISDPERVRRDLIGGGAGRPETGTPAEVLP